MEVRAELRANRRAFSAELKIASHCEPPVPRDAARVGNTELTASGSLLAAESAELKTAHYVPTRRAVFPHLAPTESQNLCSALRNEVRRTKNSQCASEIFGPREMINCACACLKMDGKVGKVYSNVFLFLFRILLKLLLSQ